MAQWQTPRCYPDHQHGILGSGPETRQSRIIQADPYIVGGNLAGNVYDNANYTWREYGQRVGVWRLFDIFDAEGVTASCTMNGKMALNGDLWLMLRWSGGKSFLITSFKQNC